MSSSFQPVTAGDRRTPLRLGAWAAFAVGALFLLNIGGLTAWSILVVAGAVGFAAIPVLRPNIFRLTRSLLILWPLLTPLGAFFNNLDAGDIDLPWASILGFADVAAVMAGVIWLARRHLRKVSHQSDDALDREEAYA